MTRMGAPAMLLLRTYRQHTRLAAQIFADNGGNTALTY